MRSESKEAAIRYRISPSRIKDLPAGRRPRELALEQGVQQVPDDILMAILLRTGAQGKSVIDLARKILDEFQGSLPQLASSSPEELNAMGIKGFGGVKRITLLAALELGKRAAAAKPDPFPLIREPAHVLNLLRKETAQLDQEVFWVLLLDQKYRLQRAPLAVTKGILNASLVHPREVFREAIRTAAAAILVAHNHPSGDPTPSAEDIQITRQLIESGRILDIQLLDHIVIGGRHPHPAPYTSLRETGLIEFPE